MQSLFLTRTRYLNGLVCPKMLWLRVNGRDTFGESPIRPQAVENSRSVQALARTLFDPVYMMEHGEYAAMEAQTAELMKALRQENEKEKKNRTIAHAVLSVRDCHCIIDFLVLLPDGAAEIYMVKGAMHVNAAAREDLAYQYTVSVMAGLKVKKAAVLTVSRDYVCTEGSTDASAFFREIDLTGEMKKKTDSVRETIAKLRIYMQQEREPVRAPSEGCFSPYDCPAFPYCGRFLPEPNVFQLSATQLADKMRLYGQGYVSFEDLAGGRKDPDDDDLSAVPGLSASARLQILCELQKRPLHADRGAVREFLSTLWEPLYFLDFEAFQPLVPKYPGTRPFDTIVFQYSAHAEDTLVHSEFLGDPASDPRRALAEKL
ncbi:MAG: DUF2779 domain-containing protein, partial [Lachnospiraceae bacterium]|nr:DUF2779 domain-containing protein [Lachnospiraceae bacterium]